MEVLIKCSKLASRDLPQRERPMQSMQSLRRNHKMHFKLYLALGNGCQTVGYAIFRRMAESRYDLESPSSVT